MKKLSILALVIIILASCKKEHSKDYLTFQGKFANNTDSIMTIKGLDINKVIKFNSDGTFKDTLKVTKNNYYSITTPSNKNYPIYLANGYNLTLNADAESSISNFKYTGEGSESNNFIVSRYTFGTSVIKNPMELFSLDKNIFDSKVARIKKGLDSIKNLYTNIDSTLLASSKSQNQRMLDYLEKNYDKQHPVAKQRASLMEKITKGKPSPKFENYENFKGGTTSLDDLKGKYVYIDLWATWCGPCIREIPSLQKTEKEYHDKNIEFVSISTDSDRRSGGTWEKANAKWKKFVTDKNLTGMQLWTGKDIKFMQDYQVTGIPRFILLDPQGNIINNDAPRPSSPELKKLFTVLGI